jgi:hypothetical protein
MWATAWKGGTYGLRIQRADRGRHFDRHWDEVVIDLDGEVEVTARLTPTFWTTCPELRGAEIGRWLRRHQLAPWPKGRPPRFAFRHISGNRFAVSLADR